MTPLAPALISPRRAVPPGIEWPEYVDRPQPERFKGSEVKDADTIERIRIAGRLSAQFEHTLVVTPTGAEILTNP